MSQVSLPAVVLDRAHSDKIPLNQLGKLGSKNLPARQISFSLRQQQLGNMSVSNLFNIALNKSSKFKPPGEMVQRLHHYVSEYERAATEAERNRFRDDIVRYLEYFKATLLGDCDKEFNREDAFELAQKSASTNLLYLLVDHLKDLNFEGRKTAAIVFSEIIKQKDNSGFSPGAQYVSLKPEILSHLVKGYEDQGLALVCGSMLRDCIQMEQQLTKVILEGPVIRKIYEKVQVKNFEIASDAFFTLRVLLSTHKTLVAQYLLEKSFEFNSEFTELLNSENFVTKLQSLKLLGDLMMAKENVKSTVNFVCDAKNLVLIMNLLKDDAKTIQFEAFHIFKVFVANPKKPFAILQILIHNRFKLVKFMEEFLNDRVYDEQFIFEKGILIQEIQKLQVINVA